MIHFEFAGKTYTTQGEAFTAMYDAMNAEGQTVGRSTREVAHDLGSRFFGWRPKSKDAFQIKQFDAIITAIDSKRLSEFPCYIPTPALDAIEIRAKELKKQFKDQSEWSRAMKKEAINQVTFARLLHIGRTVDEAMAEHA